MLSNVSYLLLYRKFYVLIDLSSIYIHTKGKTKEKMERGSRKRSSSARSEKMERGGDR
jgi:hypothetical protein